MPIYNTNLKYGHENFTFEIIEYCKPSEKGNKKGAKYLDNFEYNVLANANSLDKNTGETIDKMRGKQNLLGYKHSQKTI